MLAASFHGPVQKEFNRGGHDKMVGRQGRAPHRSGPDKARRDDDDEFGLFAFELGAPEEGAEYRQIPEARQLADALVDVVPEEARDGKTLAVAQLHRGRGASGVEARHLHASRVEAEGGVGLADFGADIEIDSVRGQDGRRELDADAEGLELDRDGAKAAGLGDRDRNFAADEELGASAAAGDQIWLSENLDEPIGLDGLDKNVQAIAAPGDRGDEIDPAREVEDLGGRTVLQAREALKQAEKIDVRAPRAINPRKIRPEPARQPAVHLGDDDFDHDLLVSAHFQEVDDLGGVLPRTTTSL